jgi:DNA (cytosine-5)-methyltransferase 1
MNFTLEFDREEDARWIAEVLELPGVLVYSASRLEAKSKVEALARCSRNARNSGMMPSRRMSTPQKNLVTPLNTQSQVAPRVAPRVLSLFSGGGGLDIGFARAGFHIVGCVEIQPECCETLRANEGAYFQPDAKVLNIDIRDFDVSSIEGQIDFIIGGPPCQTFSAIGRRAGGAQGTDDARGTLFEEYCRIVAHYQPTGFLFENVRGIISSNQGQDWRGIKAAFRDIGYELSYKILNAADFGVAQKRERLIMVGTQSKFQFSFPHPTHGPDSGTGLTHVSALEAISDLQDPNEPDHEYDGKYGHLLSEVPPGQNYHYFTAEMGYARPVFAWRSRFSDFLYKAALDEPVRTVVAKLGKYSGPFHWKNRRFTMSEMKRLQSFPDDYFLHGTQSEKLQQIGNSVPPIFAERLAESVLQSIFGVDLGIKTLHENFKFSFDAAKGNKARKTRKKRNVTTFFEDAVAPLFENFDDTTIDHTFDYTREIAWYYGHPAQQNLGTSDQQNFSIHSERRGDVCFVKVVGAESSPSIRYTLTFHRPIGNGGLKEIVCDAFIAGEQLFVVWDAIEACLKENTSYQTMFDIYGHFTEPHPIFNLKCEIFKEGDSLLKLGCFFSKSIHCKQVLHFKELENIMGLPITNSHDFIELIKRLRFLRFDVRVHQTNSKIPLDHFRCCYPFTLSLSRQIAVTWTDYSGTVQVVA